MSVSTAIVFSLTATCFALFYLSSIIELPVKLKGFTYYFNYILKIFFMQLGILLIPTIISVCNIILMDMGTFPATLQIIDKVTGFVWMIYYVYAAIYFTTLIFYSIGAAFKDKNVNDVE